MTLSDLRKVGRPAVLMSFVPACLEIIGYVFFAPLLLGLKHIEAEVMGTVLSAVSPAVVVPRMVKLIEDKYGKKKSIPQMILAGASCDDIFVIVLFSSFVTIAKGGSAKITEFLNIPISIVFGVLLGLVVGIAVFIFLRSPFSITTRSETALRLLFSSAFLYS